MQKPIEQLLKLMLTKGSTESTKSTTFIANNYNRNKTTLQGINISHLGKRKIIFKMPFLGDMLVPWRVIITFSLETMQLHQVSPSHEMVCWHLLKPIPTLTKNPRRTKGQICQHSTLPSQMSHLAHNTR